jgi:hypothetical protein
MVWWRPGSDRSIPISGYRVEGERVPRYTSPRNVRPVLQAGTTLPLRKMEQPDQGTPMQYRGLAVDLPFCMDGFRLDLPVGRARPG